MGIVPQPILRFINSFSLSRRPRRLGGWFGFFPRLHAACYHPKQWMGFRSGKLPEDAIAAGIARPQLPHQVRPLVAHLPARLGHRAANAMTIELAPVEA